MATYVFCNDEESCRRICYRIKQLSHLVRFSQWIVDAYVSDFYTLRHWDKLPMTVQNYFDDCTSQDLTWLINKEKESLTNHNKVPPLYLLSLQCSVRALSLNRNAVDVSSDEATSGIHHILKAKETVDHDQNVIDQNQQNTPGCEYLGVGDSTSTANTVSVDKNVSNGRDICIEKSKELVNVRGKACKTPNYKNGQCLDMYHIFRRHVKPKKQHEIQKLGEAISFIAKAAKCNNVVDVGAGLGHLSRVLKFKHDLEVTTVEAADGHAPKAKKYDQEMNREIHKAITKLKDSKTEVNDQYSTDAKLLSPSDIHDNSSLPHHVVCHIEPDIGISQFTDILSRTALQKDPVTFDWSKFVLAGLHACGDLTPTLLRVFSQSPSGVALASVACCYHKMSAVTTDGNSMDTDKLENYPMSEYLKSLPDHQISYEAKEMACHFADAYKERLEKNLNHLKIHSYRGGLQYLIKKIKPDFKCGQVRLVSKKGAEGSFSKYAEDNLGKVGIDLGNVSSNLLNECENLTSNWMQVVAFYTLRLSLAPAIETLILLDRMLFLFEKGIPSVLVPIFDSSISPRNFALLALKM